MSLVLVGESGGKSFTSLEELLNITGINTPDYKAPGSSDNGVDSLSKIAQAVESSQQGTLTHTHTRQNNHHLVYTVCAHVCVGACVPNGA